MKVLLTVVLLITIIGALNWGFHAAGFNLVEKFSSLFGNSASTVSSVVYYLVAAAGLVTLVLFIKDKMYKSDDDKNKEKSQ
jgi:uncharacterized membrane protein YuzA (DUF378 family)